ncbi:MAG: carboxypeptidase regulatory-like domain-containing protein [Promethearchaeota archaeon]
MILIHRVLHNYRLRLLIISAFIVCSMPIAVIVHDPFFNTYVNENDYNNLMNLPKDTFRSPINRNILHSSANTSSLNALISPTGLNGPTDITIDENDTLYIANTRARNIVKINTSEDPLKFNYLEMERAIYALDYDPVHKWLIGLAIYEHELLRIYLNGSIKSLANISEVESETPLSVDPTTGNTYIAVSSESSQCKIIRITPDGSVSTLYQYNFPIYAIDIGPTGLLYFTTYDFVYKLNLQTGAFNSLVKIPKYFPSYHGLYISDNYAYFSSGDWKISGSIYRLALAGNNEPQTFATLSDNGVEGIIGDSNGNIYAVQRCESGLIKITSSGALNYLQKGNGLNSPQDLCVSPYGEVYIANDDAARIVRYFNGNTKFAGSAATFSPPHAYIASDYFGRILLGEYTIGVESKLVWFENQFNSSDTTKRIFSNGIKSLTGITFSPNDIYTIYVAENVQGNVKKVAPNGTISPPIIEANLPLAIQFDWNGGLWMVAHDRYVGEYCDWGNIIYYNNGSATKTIEFDDKLYSIYDMAIDPWGNIFVTGNAPLYGFGLYKVFLNGSVICITNATKRPDGITLDIAGDILFTDSVEGALYRIINNESKGTIVGQVRDPNSGTPIPNAQVQIWRNRVDYAGIVVETDANGNFSVQVAPGKYDIRILSGFPGEFFENDVLVQENKTNYITINEVKSDYPSMPEYPDLTPTNLGDLYKLIIAILIQVFIYGLIVFLIVRLVRHKRNKVKNNVAN